MAVLALVRSVGSKPGEPPRVFDPERIHLICGDDNSAPNELSGCWFDVVDGRFGELGNQVRPLTQPVMAPDRSLIAYAERRDGVPVVVLRRPDGSEDLALALPSFSGPQDWSPDGENLVVVDRSAVIVIDLVTSRSNGGTVFDRFDLPAGQEMLGVARFGPSGRRIAVVTKEVDRPADTEFYRVLVIDRIDRTIAELDLVEAPLGAGFTGTVADPAIHPDGTRVAWAEGVTGSLRLYDLAGEEANRYPLGGPASLVTGVSWSPTGLLAVGVDARLQLWDFSGEPIGPSWPLPADWTITSAPPAWSPGGTRFVVTAQVPETDALLDLVVVDLEADSLRLLSGTDRPPPPVSVFPGFPVWAG